MRASALLTSVAAYCSMRYEDPSESRPGMEAGGNDGARTGIASAMREHPQGRSPFSCPVFILQSKRPPKA